MFYDDEINSLKRQIDDAKEDVLTLFYQMYKFVDNIENKRPYYISDNIIKQRIANIRKKIYEYFINGMRLNDVCENIALEFSTDNEETEKIVVWYYKHLLKIAEPRQIYAAKMLKKNGISTKDIAKTLNLSISKAYKILNVDN